MVTPHKINGHSAVPPLSEPEDAIANLRQLCTLLVQALRIAEGGFAQIEGYARDNRGAVLPDGVIMPMRETVKRAAGQNCNDLRNILSKIDGKGAP